VETDKRDGKQVRSKRFMVNPGDASTLSVIADDTLKGTTVFVAVKQ
jgi:hypothetical protein